MRSLVSSDTLPSQTLREKKETVLLLQTQLCLLELSEASYFLSVYQTLSVAQEG